ncbi:SMP-30/gluconolactonase/LRE family protein [Cumulibacter soli]|uniref:SMP-30/gluconolactonase/LRE family protein n=1 Tax=Cumulibacter soli TaxID=2546344 RepID=UPI001FBB3187|nr:SMP-30/gluconolactonase/LRE family protein [Cumulibacter soli]
MLEQVADGFTFLEGPRWHDGKLFVSDFYTGRVITVADDGAIEEVVKLDDRPSGMGWAPDGSMLLVSMTEKKLLRVRDQQVSVHADLSSLASGFLNDMVVDAEGRAYVGHFGFNLFEREDYRTASVIVVHPDSSAQTGAEEMHFPNGSMITPDGSTLIVNESYGNRISKFEILPDGMLGARQDFAVFGDAPTTSDLAHLQRVRKAAPDGGCLDADGAVWFADAAGSRLVRVAEGGEVLQEIAWGGGGLFACMLGGADGRTLYACGAPDSNAHKRAAEKAAVLLSTRVDVPHAGRP